MTFPLIKKENNIIFIRITDEIKKSAFQRICNELEQSADNGPLRLILEVHHYPSFNSAEDLYYDLRFVKLYANRIERVAVISDVVWKETWVALFALFASVTMVFFTLSQARAALEWVNNG